MNWAWLLRLKPMEKYVLMSLADSADDEGYCWPSVPTLAHKTCMDERSVQRILKKLKDSNFIKVQARFRADGSPTSNKYRLSMANCGDKLSPPSRQTNHEVVTTTTPLGGSSVTLTTTEPIIKQKTPQPNRELFRASRGSTDYIFPKQLTAQEREVAKSQLDSIDPILAQAVLDELAARLNANKVTGAPLSYLRSLITRTKTGQFMPEAGIRIASAREQAKLEQLKKATDVIKPCNPSEIPKHLAAMHHAIGRKSQPEEQE